MLNHDLVIGRIVHCVNRDGRGQDCNPAIVVRVPTPDQPIRVRVFTETNAGYSVRPYHSHINEHQHTWHWPDECDLYRTPKEEKLPHLIGKDKSPITLFPGRYTMVVDQDGKVNVTPVMRYDF